jgi:hypothetical protein
MESKTLNELSGVQAEIWTKYLPNTGTDSYRYGNPIGTSWTTGPLLDPADTWTVICLNTAKFNVSGFALSNVPSTGAH